MSEDNNSITITEHEPIDMDSLFKEAPVKLTKYKCRLCQSICQGVVMWFYKNESVGIDRDYKFCWVCWLNMHKHFCGEVYEVVEEEQAVEPVKFEEIK